MIKRYDKVRITHIPNLELGEPHQCHNNSYEYCLRNKNAKFVCGWLGITPHCVVYENEKLIDPTLNRAEEFTVFHIYSLDEITKLFLKHGCSFIPFSSYVDGKLYDGMNEVADNYKFLQTIYSNLN